MMREIVVNGRFFHGVSRVWNAMDERSFPLLGTGVVLKRCWNGIAGHMWEQFMLPTGLKSDSILWSPANTGPLMMSNQALTIHDLSPLEHPEWFQKRFAVWYRLFFAIAGTAAFKSLSAIGLREAVR